MHEGPMEMVPLKLTKAGCVFIIFRQRNNYLQRFNKTKGLVLGVAGS